MINLRRLYLCHKKDTVSLRKTHLWKMPRSSGAKAALLLALLSQIVQVSGFAASGGVASAALRRPHIRAHHRVAGVLNLEAKVSVSASARLGALKQPISAGMQLMVLVKRNLRALVSRMMATAVLVLAMSLTVPACSFAQEGAESSESPAAVSIQQEKRTLKQSAMVALSTASATGLIIHGYLAWREQEQASMRRG